MAEIQVNQNSRASMRDIITYYTAISSKVKETVKQDNFKQKKLKGTSPTGK